MPARVLMEPLEHLGIHPGDPVRRLAQALAIGVFSHGESISRTARRIRSRSIDVPADGGRMIIAIIPASTCGAVSSPLPLPAAHGQSENSRALFRM